MAKLRRHVFQPVEESIHRNVSLDRELDNRTRVESPSPLRVSGTGPTSRQARPPPETSLSLLHPPCLSSALLQTRRHYASMSSCRPPGTRRSSPPHLRGCLDALAVALVSPTSSCREVSPRLSHEITNPHSGNLRRRFRAVREGEESDHRSVPLLHELNGLTFCCQPAISLAFSSSVT